MDENLTAEVNSVTYHMTALIVTTAVKTSDLTIHLNIQGGSNMTGTDLCVNKPHCTEAVLP